MTNRIQNRRANSPAYYLARPAGLWLAALAPRPADRSPARAACAQPSGTGSAGTGSAGTGPDAAKG